MTPVMMALGVLCVASVMMVPQQVMAVVHSNFDGTPLSLNEAVADTGGDVILRVFFADLVGAYPLDGSLVSSDVALLELRGEEAFRPVITLSGEHLQVESMEFEHIVFVSVTHVDYGGTLYVLPDGWLSLNSVEFVVSTAAVAGGVVYSAGGAIEATSTAFGTAGATYGGSLAGLNATITLTNCSSTYSVAELEGGFAHVIGGGLTGTVTTGRVAAQQGFFVYGVEATIEATNVTVHDPLYTTEGGAAFAIDIADVTDLGTIYDGAVAPDLGCDVGFFKDGSGGCEACTASCGIGRVMEAPCTRSYDTQCSGCSSRPAGSHYVAVDSCMWECNGGLVTSVDGLSCEDPCHVPVHGVRTGTVDGCTWACIAGYGVVDDACVACDVPANAVLTGDDDCSFACVGGYQVSADGGSCVSADCANIPAHAVQSGTDCNFSCVYGYMEDGGSCLACDVPENAVLTGEASCEFACVGGYEVSATGDACLSLACTNIPDNAVQTGANCDWVCACGYGELNGGCVACDIPDFAILTGEAACAFTCVGGYEVSASGDACLSLACTNIPDNAVQTGANCDWLCASGYGELNGGCVACDIPDFAILTGEAACAFTCVGGYEVSASGDACLSLACTNIPDNAVQTGANCDWVCASGYGELNGGCVACDIPDFATLTGEAACAFTCVGGYEVSATGDACLSLACTNIPDNAVQTGANCDWLCASGYGELNGGCVACDIPDFAILTGEAACAFTCVGGYNVSSDGLTCDQLSCLDIPDHAVQSGQGCNWTCLYGFGESGDTCEPCALPDNAVLTGEPGCAYACVGGYHLNAPGTACEIGGSVCPMTDVPDFAVIVGDECEWACLFGFREDSGVCVACQAPEHAVLVGDRECSFLCLNGYVPSDDGTSCVTSVTVPCPTDGEFRLDSATCVPCTVQCELGLYEALECGTDHDTLCWPCPILGPNERFTTPGSCVGECVDGFAYANGECVSCGVSVVDWQCVFDDSRGEGVCSVSGCSCGSGELVTLVDGSPTCITYGHNPETAFESIGQVDAADPGTGTYYFLAEGTREQYFLQKISSEQQRYFILVFAAGTHSGFAFVNGFAGGSSPSQLIGLGRSYIGNAHPVYHSQSRIAALAIEGHYATIIGTEGTRTIGSSGYSNTYTLASVFEKTDGSSRNVWRDLIWSDTMHGSYRWQAVSLPDSSQALDVVGTLSQSQWNAWSTDLSALGRGSDPVSSYSYDTYHYLPDDLLPGGGQWLFRENYDNTPNAATNLNIVQNFYVR